MKINKISILIFILVTVVFSGSAEEGKWSLSLETGPVFTGNVSVQVPNPEGTLFYLNKDLSTRSKIYYRLRLSYKLADRHTLSLLYAPLTIKADGTAPSDILFDKTLFSAGETLEGSYTFNSYRLTWRYLLVKKEKFKLWLGFTSKIRDAEIRITTPGKDANTTNVGFVPLLNLVMDWQWTENSGLFFEADAAAAPGGQGRAEDVAISYYHRLSPLVKLSGGFRFVEGGADVEQVYNFSFIYYFFGGITLSF